MADRPCVSHVHRWRSTCTACPRSVRIRARRQIPSARARTCLSPSRRHAGELRKLLSALDCQHSLRRRRARTHKALRRRPKCDRQCHRQRAPRRQALRRCRKQLRHRLLQGAQVRARRRRRRALTKSLLDFTRCCSVRQRASRSACARLHRTSQRRAPKRRMNRPQLRRRTHISRASLPRLDLGPRA